ncbi:MAG: hypothetical protein ACI8SR_002673 [Oceanicoccus sp.]|jgi:hypothetical protein
MSKKIIITAIVTFFLGVYFYNNDISLIESHSTQFKHSHNNASILAPAHNLTNNQQTNTQTSPHAVPTPVTQASSIAETIARIKEKENRTPLQDNLITDHKQFKRYPEGNAAIPDAKHDPVLQRYEIDERTTMSEDKNVGLTIWSDKKFYLKTDTVTINAFIQDNEGRKLSTTFNAELLDTRQHPLTKLTFNSTGGNNYQTSINLADLSGPLNAGIYKVIINNSQYNLTDALTFTLTQPDIELTGEFKENIDSEGQLIINVQVLVAATSQYYVQASLYSSTGVPIGVTQSSTQLSTGLHWLPLNYSGVMIKDAGESGPYVLKNVSLAKVTIPMMRAPLVEPGFTTDSYTLDEFGE